MAQNEAGSSFGARPSLTSFRMTLQNDGPEFSAYDEMMIKSQL